MDPGRLTVFPLRSNGFQGPCEFSTGYSMRFSAPGFTWSDWTCRVMWPCNGGNLWPCNGGNGGRPQLVELYPNFPMCDLLPVRSSLRQYLLLNGDTPGPGWADWSMLTGRNASEVSRSFDLFFRK